MNPVMLLEARIQILLQRSRTLRSFLQDQDADESLLLRILENEIALMALEITVTRKVTGAEEILAIRLPELEQELAVLISESMGYYGLIHEPGGEGENEPPIDSRDARILRSAMLEITGHSTVKQRDMLAKKLLDHDT